MNSPARSLGTLIWTHRAFSALLFAVMGLRFALLFHSFGWADGDESVVGVMALHVFRGVDRPIYFWGQPYAGGGAIEAYLGALAYALFGVSSVSMKLVPLTFSLVSLGLFYIVSERQWGRCVALWVVAIVGLASPLVEWSFRARGGYAEIPFYTALVWFGLDRLQNAPVDRKKWIALGSGFTMGLAYYSLEIILPLFIALAVYGAWVRPAFLTHKVNLWAGAGFLIGLSPCLIFNLNHELGNFRYVFGAASGLTWHPSELWERTAKFPSFFQSRNVDAYPEGISWLSAIEMTLFLVLAGRGGVDAWKDRKSKPSGSFDLAALCAIQVLVQLPLILLNGRTASSPRYFLPVFVPIAVLAGATVGRLSEQVSSKCAGLAAIAAGGVLILLGGLTHLKALRNSSVNDDVLMADGRIANVQVSGESIKGIIDLLDANGIRAIRATYFVQWRLIFESHERLSASSNGLCPSGYRHPAYDQAVAASLDPAIVLHKLSAENSKFAELRGLDRREVGEYFVYLPVRSGEPVKHSASSVH